MNGSDTYEPAEPKTFLIRDLPSTDRPRARLLSCGSMTLSDSELLAILLRNGRPGSSAIHLAQEVLNACGGLAGLLRSSESSLRCRGIGPAKAATLLAAVELSRRIARARMPRRDLLENPEAVASYLQLRYGNEDQEVMGALYLDVRNRLIAEKEIFRGTLSRLRVEPRAVIRQALIHSAYGFILFHNHPSGDPSPSAEDLTVTRRMAEAAELLGVTLLDHMILGNAGRWVSLGRRGAW